jgi:hypothetical protein
MTINATSSGTRPIRVGLIGAGNWAHHGHLPVLTLLPEYEISKPLSRNSCAAISTIPSRFSAAFSRLTRIFVSLPAPAP